MNQHIFSVSEINNRIKNLVESNFYPVSIKGEISDLKISHAHMYFTIKDESSSLSCALWNYKTKTSDYVPQSGDKVILKGKPNFWPKGGKLNFNVNNIQKSGEGDLWAQFQLLKKKLYNKGLFDEQSKKPIKKYPSKIAVISSETGSVIEDILNVIVNNTSYLNVVLRNCKMQGESAAEDIIEAIDDIHNYNSSVDAIIIARGGGSFEDLWCFNDEQLAYKIFSSKIPIITAIGHETDTTIADYVSDLRAATPSIAAKIVAPSTIDCIQDIEHYHNSIKNIIINKINNLTLKVDSIKKRHGLHKAKYILKNHHDKFLRIKNNITSFRLKSFLTSKLEKYQMLSKNLFKSADLSLKNHRNKINYIENIINSYNPENVMKKGYSIVYKGKKVIKDTITLTSDEIITIKFHKGKINAKTLNDDN